MTQLQTRQTRQTSRPPRPEPLQHMIQDFLGWDPFGEAIHWPGRSVAHGRRRIPRWTTHTEDGKRVFIADFRGFQPEEVDIVLSGNRLVISGSRGGPMADRRDPERDSGICSFARTFTVPAGLQPEDVEATWDQGRIEVRVPWDQEASPRRVPMKILVDGSDVQVREAIGAPH